VILKIAPNSTTATLTSKTHAHHTAHLVFFTTMFSKSVTGQAVYQDAKAIFQKFSPWMKEKK
jgi:hypothetical protein